MGDGDMDNLSSNLDSNLKLGNSSKAPGNGSGSGSGNDRGASGGGGGSSQKRKKFVTFTVELQKDGGPLGETKTVI